MDHEEILLEEARRKLDRQEASLDEVRRRSITTLATAAVVDGLFAFHPVTNQPVVRIASVVLGLLPLGVIIWLVIRINAPVQQHTGETLETWIRRVEERAESPRVDGMALHLAREMDEEYQANEKYIDGKTRLLSWAFFWVGVEMFVWSLGTWFLRR